jgi:hypothetical protein
MPRATKTTKETKKSRSKMERLLNDHADDVAETIVAFLPPGYRYVAGVSRTFRDVYCGRRTGNKTSVEWAVASPRTAAIFVKECPDDKNEDDHDDDPRIVVTRHKACTYAAQYGCLATLQWLRDETVHDMPLPWDRSTLIAAARADTASSRKCLVYAIDHGCPWRLAFFRQWEREEGQDPLFSDLVKFVDRMVAAREAYLLLTGYMAFFKRDDPIYQVWPEQHPALFVERPVLVTGRWDDARQQQRRRLLDEPGEARRPRHQPREDRRQQRHLPPQKRGGQRRRPPLQQPQPSKGRRRS